MNRRLWLHVGTPKTGTTFLQTVAWRHRSALRSAGLLLPGRGVGDHFRATADLRGEPFRLKDPTLAQGAWQRLVDRAAAWGGDVLVSHELFGPATAERAAAGVAALRSAAGPDAEVHVVVTARDLVRQIPAEWQEHLKHRSVLDLESFVHSVRTDPDGPFSPNGYHFWHVQDLPELLGRWRGDLPADHLHVVTVPPSGGGREELWRRFAGLLGVGDVEIDWAGLDAVRSNTSLAAEQAELMRRLNLALGDRLPLPGTYPDVAKGFLAHQVLARRPGTSYGLVGDDLAWARDRGAAMVDALRSSGVDVVGDWADLLPPAGAAGQPATSGTARVAESRVAEEAVEALVAALERLAVERERVARLREERDRARAELEQLDPAELDHGPHDPESDGSPEASPARAARRAVRALRRRA